MRSYQNGCWGRRDKMVYSELVGQDIPERLLVGLSEPGKLSEPNVSDNEHEGE